jgi:GTP:adenosylcobinamide-phosphate guanylyltransferase
MNAIITAGGRPQENEPLFPETRGGFKALLDIAGKPMIQWVLEALEKAKSIERIVIVGLPEDHPFKSEKLVATLPGRENMVENIRAGVRELLKDDPHIEKVIVASSDIPAIDEKMVDWLANIISQTDQDFYYNVIERQTMEKSFPGSRRTYLKLKDSQLCGGDINGISTRVLEEDNPMWLKLVEARKSPLNQAALLGLPLLIGLILRNLTLPQAVEKACDRMGIRGQAILCPFAEMGMDVDKPFQLALMRQYFQLQTA